MKKLYYIIIIMLLCFTLFGCQSPTASVDPTAAPTKSQDIYPTFTTENDHQFLVLPISKTSVYIGDKESEYIDAIDAYLLRAAEEKINGEANKYNAPCVFYIDLRDGKLYLAAEIIASIDPPLSTSGAGCGIDHDHIFFSEPITP